MNSGFSPQSQPVAPFTWELQATLSRTSESSARVPARWHQPIIIYGMYPVVIAGSAVGGGLLTPTVNDILAIVSSNQKERFTNRLEDVTPTNVGEAYVTLASLSSSQGAANRLLNIRLEEDAPQLDIGFRWKRFTAGTPIYEDAIVSVALFCDFLRK